MIMFGAITGVDRWVSVCSRVLKQLTLSLCSLVLTSLKELLDILSK